MKTVYPSVSLCYHGADKHHAQIAVMIVAASGAVAGREIAFAVAACQRMIYIILDCFELTGVPVELGVENVASAAPVAEKIPDSHMLSPVLAFECRKIIGKSATC
jgi:hypothetical protein